MKIFISFHIFYCFSFSRKTISLSSSLSLTLSINFFCRKYRLIFAPCVVCLTFLCYFCDGHILGEFIYFRYFSVYNFKRLISVKIVFRATRPELSIFLGSWRVLTHAPKVNTADLILSQTLVGLLSSLLHASLVWRFRLRWIRILGSYVGWHVIILMLLLLWPWEAREATADVRAEFWYSTLVALCCELASLSRRFNRNPFLSM